MVHIYRDDIDKETRDTFYDMFSEYRNKKGDFKCLGLIEAYKYGNIEKIEYIEKDEREYYDANIDTYSSAIIYCVYKHGNIDMINYVNRKFDVNKYYQNMCMGAFDSKNEDIMKLIYTQFADDRYEEHYCEMHGIYSACNSGTVEQFDHVLQRVSVDYDTDIVQQAIGIYGRLDIYKYYMVNYHFDVDRTMINIEILTSALLFKNKTLYNHIIYKVLDVERLSLSQQHTIMVDCIKSNDLDIITEMLCDCSINVKMYEECIYEAFSKAKYDIMKILLSSLVYKYNNHIIKGTKERKYAEKLMRSFGCQKR
jgi:hypothetical protein